MTEPVSTAQIHAELDRARTEFHGLAVRASDEDLARKSDGTDWTNRQLLFHMLFGYLIVQNLRVVVRFVGRAPDLAQRVFAGALDATTPVFHKVNYWGSCAGAVFVSSSSADAWLGRVIASLHRHLDCEHDWAMRRTMRFPRRWDPYFTEQMSLAEVYQPPCTSTTTGASSPSPTTRSSAESDRWPTAHRGANVRPSSGSECPASVRPALHNVSLSALVAGDVIALAGVHHKVRRDGYARSTAGRRER